MALNVYVVTCDELFIDEFDGIIDDTVTSHFPLHEGLTTFLFSFSPRKILISYSVNFYKRKVREDQIAHLSMGCTQGVFSLALALQQCFRGGPPTSNYFPFATQTCLEKFQGLYYEESF